MNGLNKIERDFEQKPRRTVLGLLIWLVVIVAVVSGVTWTIRTVFYPVGQAGRVMERTLDADNVIRNYEWFKQQNEDIQAIDVRLETARQSLTRFEESAGPRESWRFDDRTEWSRLNSIVQGLEGSRTEMVAQYNARAQMANRNIFRDNNLPEQIEQATN